MKNLTRKLFLSICTLAICAVTLVSTTFAWYTTNTEVVASSVSGTATTEGAASIYVSKDKINWAQTITLTEKSATSLVPVQLVKVGNSYQYLALDGTEDLKATGAVVTFKLYFKTALTDRDVNLFISDLEVYNKADQLTLFDNLLYTGTDSTAGGLATETSKYGVDIVKSLAMTTISSQVAFATATDEANYGKPDTETKHRVLVNTPASDGNQGKKEIFENFVDLQSLVMSYTDTNLIPLQDSGVDAANALEYYNKVMFPNSPATGEGSLYKKQGENVVALDKEFNVNPGTRTQIALLPQEGYYVEVDFTIYINGWDEYCYDACKGQSFVVNFKFSTVDSNN